MKIVIDPGHGGVDPGAVAASHKEKNFVLGYSRELIKILERRRHLLLATRMNDSEVALSKRALLANDWGADVFISIHANAADSKLANGAWVIYDDKSKPEDGRALAESVFNALAEIPGIVDSDLAKEIFPDRSPAVGGRNLAVLSQTKMPAILIELGFMTNEEDMRTLLLSSVREDVCRAIADGVESWAIKRGLLVEDATPTPSVEQRLINLEHRVAMLEERDG